MKIATTTGDFASYFDNDSDRIKELHRAGFKYIDLDMYSFTPDSPYMKDNWMYEVRKIKTLADELGMKFVQAHSQGGNALSENTEEVEFLIKATIRSIEICKELGIKNTVAHCGFAANIDKDEFFKRNSRFYEKLFPAMEACNVNVLVENSMITQFYYLNSGKDMCEFLKYVGHPQLHACWDTGHGNILGTQYEHISELGDDLYAIHYNDNHGNLDEHILPFMGILNHDEVINALIDINYKGYFTLECSSSLLQNDNWLFKRKQYIKSERLINPQLFMQRRIEALLYDTAEYILSAYDIFEK